MVTPSERGTPQGGSVSVSLSNVYLLALPALKNRDARLVEGKQEAWLAGAGANVVDGQPGDTVSLIPLNGAVHGIRTEGFEYPLRDETLTFGPARGVSNVLDTPRGIVHVAEGTLLVVHTIGRA